MYIRHLCPIKVRDMAVLPLGFVFSANLCHFEGLFDAAVLEKKKRACTDTCVRGLEENTIQMRKQSTQSIFSYKTY